MSATYVALTAESQLRSGLSRVKKLKRTLIKVEKELASGEKQVAQNKDTITRLTAANVDFNARLARITPGDVTANNKLVGMINTNIGQLKLLDTQRKNFADAIQKVRSRTNQAREDYVGHIIAMRNVAIETQNDYADKQADDTIKSLLDELETLTKKKFELKQSRMFETALKELQKLESTVLTESIKLRRQDDTYYASVVVNGKAREMVVDSGSTLIALPWKVAKEMGVKIRPSDKPIKLTLADGRSISGTLVVLDAVRIGAFTVNKVEAAILGVEAPFAEPLLGMSYLKHFKFEMKPDAALLKLVRLGKERSPKPKR